MPDDGNARGKPSDDIAPLPRGSSRAAGQALLLDALLISGGLNTSAWAALVRAAVGDTVFAAQLGDRHRRAFARFTIPELHIGTGVRYRRVSGIAIGRNAADVENALIERVLRIAPRKGASEATYLLVRTLGTRLANPQRASTVEELSREQLIDKLDTLESRPLFVQCVQRDLNLARAARAAGKMDCDARGGKCRAAGRHSPRNAPAQRLQRNATSMGQQRNITYYLYLLKASCMVYAMLLARRQCTMKRQ